MPRKPPSRYAADWSYRIDILKKTLAAQQARVQEPAPAQGSAPAQGGLQALSEQFKRFQEASAHEIRQISLRCQELEAFVKAKEIDLQNLKSESVEHRLNHQDLKKNIAEQGAAAPRTAEAVEDKVRELTDRVNALQTMLSPVNNPPAPATPFETALDEPSFFSRCLAWWNEPVAKIPVPKGGADGL